MGKFTRRWILPLVYFTDNWLSRIGLFLLLSATVLWIFLTGASAASGYLGILQFVALPATFFLGLVLVPLGISLQRRRESPDHHVLPDKIDLANRRVLRFLLFVGGATCANLIIGGALTYQTVHYMESTNFCGTACHVMAPEFAAYQAGAHAQVKCVECHIGEGAGNAIRAKVNGTRQLFLVTTGRYQRPIPSPPHGLKAAGETCENCHSPRHDYGQRLWRRTQFNDAGERLETALMLKLGAIHRAHRGVSYEAADERRSRMLAVRTKSGAEYATDGYRAGKETAVFRRDMDCLDCHNRPAHEFENPERSVDQMMTEGRLPQRLPLFRKAALDALRGEYAPGAAAAALPARLLAFYEKNQPAVPREELVKAGRELVSLYERNVFPAMRVGWGTYPQHLGHTDSPGCFRCHGDELKPKKAGQGLTQDCEACHKVIGVEEKDLKAMQELGG
ncbi:MAG: NapC/NirT family cytochrome c [Bryobacteraceae bacterium]|nr:NapC/NirT family cytochrome c [Bryobacteraceae bacterium]